MSTEPRPREANARAVDPTALAPRLVRAWLTAEPERRHRQVRGALVFLDISGFTALSESLAGRGRIGAEEIRDVINATFTAILDVAYADGGSLLKFGGDAVLLLFDGDQAGSRAARAARGMLDVLLARNPVRTSAGAVALGATVGVSEGPIDLYLVGESHRELLVLGRTASDVIRLESMAPPDTVLVSDTIACGLPASTLGEAVQEARLLQAAPPAGAPIPAPRLRAVDHNGWMVVPAALRGYLETAHAVGAHRRATIAFLQLRGTDQRVAANDPVLADELHELAVSVQRAGERFGVTWLSSDVDRDGAKIILAAGLPTGDDDDSDRLVHAVKQVLAETTTLDLRAGMHRGPVFSGVVGPDYRLTFTILGDAVNLAARTMSRAADGQVLATTAVLNGLRTLYQVDMLEPFSVKGKTQPVRAGIVGTELGTRLRQRSDENEFVGRERELQRLVDAVDASLSGEGRAFEITGPAGIGKSRLLDEVQDQRPHYPLYLVACTRFSSERPYRSVAMLLRLALTGERHGPAEAVLDAARSLVAGSALERWLPLLGPILDLDVPDTPQTAELDPAHRPARIREVVGQLLSTAVPQPAGFVIEDAQWLDPESRVVFLDGIRRLLPRRPWLMLLTGRDPLDLPDGVSHLRVGPLPESTARAYALRFVDRGLIPIEQVGLLVERAEGNPLYLAELAAAAPGGDIPDDVESLIRQRLDALPPAAARLVAHAAVLGLEFPAELLESVAADDPAIHGSVDYRTVPDLLSRMRSGYLRFRQSLYQEVAYETLPYRERRELHRRAAAALASLADQGAEIVVEARSRHHHLGGDYQSSWEHSRQAMLRAHERLALTSAVRFAQRSLEAAGRIRVPAPERAEVWERLGDILEQAGGYEDARLAYRKARRLQKPSPALCRKYGHVLERQGRYAQALRWYTIGLSEAAGDAAEHVALTMRRAITLLRQGRPVEAAGLARSALPTAQRLRDDRLQGYLHYVLAWSMSDLSDPAQADERDRAAFYFERAGDLRGQSLLENEIGTAAYYHGRWDVAVNSYRRSMTLLERLGDTVQAAATRANVGEILADQGYLDDAVETLEAALRLLEIAHHGIGVMLTQGFLARAVARRGDFDRADALYRAAVGEGRSAHAPGLVVDLLTRRAEAAAFARQWAAARGHLDLADREQQTDVMATGRTVRCRVEGILAVAAGDLVSARACFDQGIEIGSGAGLVYETGLTQAAAGRLLDDDEQRVAARLTLAPLDVVGDPAILALGPLLAEHHAMSLVP